MKFTGSSRSLDDLSELATRLPWWGGLLSALAAYVLLQPVATLQLPAPTGTLDAVTTALAQLFVFLARVAQYLLPLAFLISAAVSGFGRWKRNDLRESVARDATGSILRGLPLSDFALLVGEAFRRQGYETSEPRIPSTGGGTTLELTRDNRRYLVDCADWRSWKAGAGSIRALFERMEATGADGGFAVTSGQFTPEAKHFAADKDIDLVDGRHLKELVRAKPSATPREAPFLLARLRSLLARFAPFADRISSDRPSEYQVVRSREPQIRSDTDRPTRARPAQDPPNGRMLADNDAEIVAGAQLTALIRAEPAIDDTIALAAPRVEERVTDPPCPPRARRPLRPRRIADAVGMLVASGILWGVYDWFSTLPDAPLGTPWALLGTSRESAVLARRMEGLQRPGLGGKIPENERPLGQFQFGPSGRIADLEAKARERGGYHSLRELEIAFDDKYVPPPECYAWESNKQMVKCGNHRIRARRAFIASGGEVTPTLLGSWEETRPVLTEVRPRDWRLYEQQDWQEGVDREWGPDQEPEGDGRQDARGGWDPDPEPYAEPDSRQHWDQEYALEPDRDWQPGYGQDPQTGRGQPWIEEPTQTTRDGVDRRPPGGDWRGVSARDWRQGPAEDAPLEPQQDWRQEWLRGSGQEPDEDWQQEWLRDPRQDADRDSQRRWESEPAPTERRHWVDDF